MDIRLVSREPSDITFRDNGIIIVEESVDLESLKLLIKDECLMLFNNNNFVYKLLLLTELVNKTISYDNGKLSFESILQAISSQIDSNFHKTQENISSINITILNDIWSNFFIKLKCILQKFVNLDISLSNQPRKKTLSESITKLFKEGKRIYNDIYPVIEKIILTELNSCRLNNNFNSERVVNLIKLLDFSGIFDEFKNNLSNQIVEYYSTLSSNWIENMDFNTYIHNVYNIYTNEHKLMKKFLNKKEINVILQRVLNILIDEKHRFLLSLNNIIPILTEKNYKLLKFVRILFRNCESYYIKILVQSLIKIGLEMILNEDFTNISDKLINKLMNFNLFINELKNYGFSSDYQFQDKLKKIYKNILENINALRIILCSKSLFYDNIIMNSELFNSDEFKFSINLFKYIKCRDDFEKLLRHVISNRLIRTHDLNNNYMTLINILKQEFGLSFTHQLVILINDFNKSNKLNSEFTEINSNYLQYETIVISNLVWFKNKFCDTLQLNFDQSIDNFNNSIDNYQENFINFYQNKYKNRKLIYIPEFFIIHLSSKFYNKIKKKEIDITFQFSLIQANLFLLLNNKNIISLDELKSDIVQKWSFNFTSDLDILIKQHIDDLININPPLIIYTNNGFMFNKNFHSECDYIEIYKPNEYKLNYNLNIITENVTILDRDTACRIDFMLVKCIKSNSCDFDNVCKFIHDNMDMDINTDLVKRQLDGLVERKFIKLDSNSNLYVYIP